MNGNTVVTGNLLENLMTGPTSGDKGFVALLLTLVSAYGVKRYFDNVDKAMDCGYNTTLKADKYGEMKFTRGTDARFSQDESDPVSQDESRGAGVESP